MKVRFANTEAEVPLELVDLVKVEDEGLIPATDDLSARDYERPDPVHTFVAKAAFKQQTEGVTTTSTGDFDFLKALNEADVRDQKPPVVTLRKDSTVPDWSWSTPVSATLGKRATPARARLNVLLDRIFGDHGDFRTEADEIVNSALNAERAAIEAEAA